MTHLRDVKQSAFTLRRITAGLLTAVSMLATVAQASAAYPFTDIDAIASASAVHYTSTVSGRDQDVQTQPNERSDTVVTKPETDIGTLVCAPACYDAVS